MTTTTDEKQMMLDWLEHHGACEEGVDWARDNCTSLQETWNTCQSDWCIWLATRPGVLTDRELRLFGCWSVRQVWNLLADKRSHNAVIVAERYAQGDATDEELAAARTAAGDAWSAARAGSSAAGAAGAARTAAGDAWSAARAGSSAAGAAGAARTAAGDAWSAARAALSAAWAARAADWPDARAAQAKWLRANTKPTFVGKGE